MIASKKKPERAYTSSLTAHLKALEQKETIPPRGVDSRKKIKLRAENNPLNSKRKQGKHSAITNNSRYANEH